MVPRFNILEQTLSCLWLLVPGSGELKDERAWFTCLVQNQPTRHLSKYKKPGNKNIRPDGLDHVMGLLWSPTSIPNIQNLLALSSSSSTESYSGRMKLEVQPRLTVGGSQWNLGNYCDDTVIDILDNHK